MVVVPNSPLMGTAGSSLSFRSHYSGTCPELQACVRVRICHICPSLSLSVPLSTNMCTYTYLHIRIQTYIHAYIHARTEQPASLHTMHKCYRTYIPTYVHTFPNPYHTIPITFQTWRCRFRCDHACLCLCTSSLQFGQLYLIMNESRPA